jgi:hypothetical protein
VTSWFAIPVRDGGYALGLVARASIRGSFSGISSDRAQEIPSMSDAEDLTPSDAVLVGTFGHTEVPVEAGVAEQGPKDGLMGAGYVERVLTGLLAGE